MPDRYAGFDEPYWADYRDALRRGPPDGRAVLPAPEDLNACLPTGTVSGGGQPIRFVDADRLPNTDYERHIFETGEVSTRRNSWHDVFNALVWSRFPAVKAALNARHRAEIIAGMSPGDAGRRGPVRDALTLLDESGALVVTHRADVSGIMARHDWRTLFVDHRDRWRNDIAVFVVGHAVLEKFLDPYKAITAHAICLRIEPAPGRFARAELRQRVDRELAARIRSGLCLNSTAELQPLPLMGIPGWWPRPEQDGGFYADTQVFRPATGKRNPLIIELE
ncbi:DUF3025 domain-containing protein [Elongatibacter sediminis]|uniref:DUF3025 domain-containing protein n=1 Tax=Elongatibacter sediminis TaxID=3119006 RepID=A0AAW9RI55_9GAMM